MKLNLALAIIGIVAMVFTIMIIDGPWYTMAAIVTAAGLTNLFCCISKEEES